MVFASPIFLFLFLPAVLATYFALPRRWGNATLVVASLAFYMWGEGGYVTIVLASIGFNWEVGRRVADAQSDRARRRWLALGIAGNLVLLAVFKYANFAIANFDAAAWDRSDEIVMDLPTGVLGIDQITAGAHAEVFRLPAPGRWRIRVAWRDGVPTDDNSLPDASVLLQFWPAEGV